MSPIRVLFVDDDPNILRALRRSLRPHRGRFDMRFADGAEAALVELETAPADVVVSDMRMPGMDGGALLSVVRDRWPETARIILSGFSDEEAVLRTVGPAHQFLNKPCDPEVLVASVERAIKLRRRLGAPELESKIAAIDTLPSPPASYLALVDALESEKSAGADIARIIDEDLAMRTATLKLVNSAFFAGTAGQVTEVLRAVQILGFDTIRALAIGVGLFSDAIVPGVPVSELERLSRRSVLLGQLAGLIAQVEDMRREDVDVALNAAMLSDLGVLVQLTENSDAYFEARATAECRRICPVEAERRACGAAHPEIGAYLLALWGFPDDLVGSVLYHHDPDLSPEAGGMPLTAVFGAQLIARMVRRAGSEGRSEPVESSIKMLLDEEDVLRLSRLKLEDRLPVWLAQTADLHDELKRA